MNIVNKILLKYNILPYILVSLTSLSFSAQQTVSEVNNSQFSDIHYSPRIELAGKLGYSSKKEQRRDIARLGFVLPIYQKSNAVTFLSLIGVKDNAKHAEGNFGAGHRVLLNSQWIVGGYGFYDLRRTQNAKMLHQTTFGIEALSKYLEFRINGYMPILTKEHKLSNKNIYKIKYSSNTRVAEISVQNKQLVEKAMPGFDIEAGGALPSLSRYEMFVAYYHFNAKDVSAVTGFRVRTNIRVAEWLSVELESNYDGSRGSTNYGGIRLGWDIGSSQPSRKTWISRKMTQLPVRDIDVVHQQAPIFNDIVPGKRFRTGKALLLESFNSSDELILEGDELDFKLFKSQEELIQSGLKADAFFSITLDNLVNMDANSNSITILETLFSNPKADKPRIDEPQTDEPQTDEPQIDEPQIDEPQTDKPQTDKPQTDEPQTDEPQTKEPQTDEPQTDELNDAPKQYKTKKAQRNASLFQDIENLKKSKNSKRNGRKKTKIKQDSTKIKPSTTIKEGIVPATSAASKMANAFKKSGTSIQDALKLKSKNLKTNARNVNIGSDRTSKNGNSVNAKKKIEEAKKRKQEEARRERKEQKRKAMKAMKARSEARKQGRNFPKTNNIKEIFANTILAQRVATMGSDSESSDTESSDDDWKGGSGTQVIKPIVIIPKNPKNTTKLRRKSFAVTSRDSKAIKNQMKNDRKRRGFLDLISSKTKPKLKKNVAQKKPVTTKAATNNIFSIMSTMHIPSGSDNDANSGNDSDDWSD